MIQVFMKHSSLNRYNFFVYIFNHFFKLNNFKIIFHNRHWSWNLMDSLRTKRNLWASYTVACFIIFEFPEQTQHVTFAKRTLYMIFFIILEQTVAFSESWQSFIKCVSIIISYTCTHEACLFQHEIYWQINMSLTFFNYPLM